MRIFALSALLCFCLSSSGQENTSEATSTRLSSSSQVSKDSSTQAAVIVEKFFAGMKTPSPVTPPLVESIEEELKKEETNWFPASGSKPVMHAKMLPRLPALEDDTASASMKPLTAVKNVSPPQAPADPVSAPEPVSRVRVEEPGAHSAERAVASADSPPPARHAATPVESAPKEKKRPLANLFKGKNKEKRGGLRKLFQKKDRAISVVK